ncbi:hypothetical protein TNCV_691141 [Trichonephila clavipes]|nr:hypothetical protein TNCV_691141 [Trichonephila clavipes]
MKIAKQEMISLLEMNKIWKTPAEQVRFKRGVKRKKSIIYVLLNFPTVSWEEFVAVEDDNMRTASIIVDKDIVEFVQSQKIIIVADSDNENEMNKAAHAPTSSEMRNIMQNMHSYLDANFNNEMNNKMYDIEQFDATKGNA